MIAFVVIAVVLALASAVWISRPLWVGPNGRVQALVTVLLVAAAAASLYLYSSNWHWPQGDTTADTPTEMVSKLARRLEREPEDLEGWMMLGRSYAALGQFPLAQRAYQRADRLAGGRDPQAIIGLAEAMVMQANGTLDDRSARLFEQALVLDPQSEKALFFAAIAAQRRGDTPLAIERFEKMLAMNPPENIRTILTEQVARLRAGPVAQGSQSPQAPAAPASAATTPTEAPRVLVAVSVKPNVAAKIASGSTLFVFVRAPGRPGPPLAVKRLPAEFPVSVELTAADSMVPGLTFAPNDTVEVSAKVSRDGNATPKSGEPIGSTRYIVGRDFKKAVVIDRLSE